MQFVLTIYLKFCAICERKLVSEQIKLNFVILENSNGLERWSTETDESDVKWNQGLLMSCFHFSHDVFDNVQWYIC